MTVTVTVIRADQPDLVLNPEKGRKLMDILAEGGLHLDAPCAGQGKCGKCLVQVEGELPPLNPNETKLLKKHHNANLRLACALEVNSDLAVTLTNTSQAFSAVQGLGQAVPYQVESPLRTRLLDAGERTNDKPRTEVLGFKNQNPAISGELAKLERPFRSAWGVTWYEELIKVDVADELPEEPPQSLVLALDLGTTGLAAAVIDPSSNTVIGQSTALNPQVHCGADVISRTNYTTENEDGLKQLHYLGLEGLRELTALAAGPEVRARIFAAVISGNTTMAHLIAGVDPYSLAQFPYRPIFTQIQDMSAFAGDLGLPKEARIFLAPAMSAYIGGDICSGLLAVDILNRPKPSLFIDIGTNGEIILADREGRLWGASCAVGPALEGMNITCGQRAIHGAVDSFKFEEGAEYKATFTTLGQETATGLCGSGLIELCAALVREGFIDKNGRLKPPQAARFTVPGEVVAQLEKGDFYLTDKVYFNQKDVRQIQLAKSAIATGVEMLLLRAGLDVNDLVEIIIAGSFGYHLRAEDLKTISLLPPSYQGPITFVGNSSLAGSAKALLTLSGLEDLTHLSKMVTTVELGNDKSFQDRFLINLRF